MCLEHLEQIETNSYPLLGRNLIRSFVSNPSHELYAVLLDLFIPVFEDRSESWQQILYRWCHFSHSDLDNDALEGSQDASKYFRILFTKTFIEVEP